MIRSLLLLPLLAIGAAAKDPFASKIAEWDKKGYAIRERITRRAGDLTGSAIVYSSREGGADRLEIYVATKDKVYLGYAHPSAGERLELEPSPAGRLNDLLGDGSLVVAYRSTLPGMGAADLNVIRWKKFSLKRVANLPEARFLTLDGKPGIASRERPLGAFLSVACDDYGTMSRSAFKTTLHAARNGVLTDVSGMFPDFYESEIARKEKSLETLKGSLEQNAGEYLGLALSSYYDYAALGRAKEGWTKLRQFFVLPAYAPPAAKACLSRMEADLRDKLGVPASWP